MNYKVSILAAMILLPQWAFPQAEPSATSSKQPALPFSGGQQAKLQFAGERAPANVLVVNAGYQAAYDDNIVLSSGLARQGDQVNSLNTYLGIFHSGARLNAVMEYTQADEFLDKLTAYNHIDQRLSTDLELQLDPHWSLNCQDTLYDQSSPFYQGLNGGATGELGFPSTINTTIFIPPINQRGNTVRTDLLWQATVRTSLSAFGGTDYRSFGSGQVLGHSLVNMTSYSSGATYAWRMSEHSTLGLLYAFEQLSLSGALPAGSPTQLDSQSALPSLGWQASPTIAITLFGGPAFTKVSAAQAADDGLPHQDSRPIVGEWGATASRQMGRSSLFLGVERTVDDGGGLTGFVQKTSFSAGFRWQLPVRGRWDATWNAQVAQNSSLTTETAAYRSDSQIEVFGLEHPLHDKLFARIGYEFARQSYTGAVPFDANFHRNRVSIGITVHWNAISLKH